MNERDVLKVHGSLSTLRQQFDELKDNIAELLANFYVDLKWTQLDLDEELGLQDARERLTAEQAEEL